MLQRNPSKILRRSKSTPESAVTGISTNSQSEIMRLNNSFGMSFPSLQQLLSVSVIIASHVWEQTHQSMFPILVFLGGQSSWGLFCFSSSSFRSFSTWVGVLSGSKIYGDKPNSSSPSEELEDSYPSLHVEIYLKIY